MTVTTPLDLVEYYAGLLILQYIGKAKASATIETFVTPTIMPQVSVQTISFALAPTVGHFVVSWDGVSSASINWNDAVGTVQTKLQAITGLGSVTVAGSISGLELTVTFTDVDGVAVLLVLESTTLLATATPVTPTIAETDVTLPFAVQDAFNLTGDNTAVGDQLDTLGKYAGVTRTGAGFTTQITLDDADFLSLIRMAILANNGGSSLYDIQALLAEFFPGEMLVFDYKNMHMSYIISTTVGSQELVQLFVTEGLLPKPMGVQVTSIIYVPSVGSLFGFRTYEFPAFSVEPFNDYAAYQTDWPWVSYANVI